VWWFVPNNFGLLCLDPQLTCTLGWAYPTIGGPRSCYWCRWWSFSVTLTPNYLDLSSVEKGTKHLSPLPEIWMRFPSLWDVCFLTTLLSRFPNFPTLSSYLSSPIYIPLSLGLSWWEDIPYVNGSLHIISLVKRDSLPTVDMTS